MVFASIVLVQVTLTTPNVGCSNGALSGELMPIAVVVSNTDIAKTEKIFLELPNNWQNTKDEVKAKSEYAGPLKYLSIDAPGLKVTLAKPLRTNPRPISATVKKKR